MNMTYCAGKNFTFSCRILGKSLEKLLGIVAQLSKEEEVASGDQGITQGTQ